MEIFYTTEAVKNLKNLSPVEKQKAKKKIESLFSNPLAGKKLRGEFSSFRSLRTWPLRIIYLFNAKSHTITIITVDYRGNVYK